MPMPSVIVTAPSEPPKCLPMAVSVTASVNWGDEQGVMLVANTYQLVFEMWSSTGVVLKDDTKAITTNETSKSTTLTASSDQEGVTFLVTLQKSTDNGVTWMVYGKRGSTSPYALKLQCPVAPTNPGTGVGTPPPPPPPIQTATVHRVAREMRTYNTAFIPTEHFRYVYAIVKRLNGTVTDNTFVKIEHVEFADFYPKQTGIPNTPRYQAEVPFYVNSWDPSTIYAVTFLFVDREGKVVFETDPYYQTV